MLSLSIIYKSKTNYLLHAFWLEHCCTAWEYNASFKLSQHCKKHGLCHIIPSMEKPITCQNMLDIYHYRIMDHVINLLF